MVGMGRARVSTAEEVRSEWGFTNENVEAFWAL